MKQWGMLLSKLKTRYKNQPYQHLWIWLVYLLLFSLSVPWYLPKGASPKVWLGLPHWVVISLSAIIGVALFTVFVVYRYWSDDEALSKKSETE